ncbi:hypothetical protein [Francisella sp. LA112445]|uniref:hypothetical protein n=1 Tax=Francisella sp. LA112445 TaxID=1395624 RepID=UPI001788E362|nr:hypothetical protein [Francisella sp. LA112445]QIW09712.1 hypothetical protein FIP56_03065 [Francisella sp. LA112445]
MTIDFEKNENTNKDLLKKLCLEASKHVNYKFLGGGTKVTIDSVNYIVPHHLSIIIKRLLVSDSIKQNSRDFKKLLCGNLSYCQPGYNIGRSSWTEKLYSHPTEIINNLNSLYISDYFTGKFTLTSKDNVFFRDLRGSWSIKVIKSKQIILDSKNQNSDNDSFRENIEKTLNDLIHQNTLSMADKNTIYSVNQNILVDVLKAFTDKKPQSSINDPLNKSRNILKRFFYFEDLNNLRDSSTDAILNFDRGSLQINQKTTKEFQKYIEDMLLENIKDLECDKSKYIKVYEQVLGNDYKSILASRSRFKINTVINFNLLSNQFDCSTELFQE